MLSRDRRLSSAQFDRAFANSLSVRHPLIALKAHRRDDDSAQVRAAFVVPKKQGNAVQRNRTRRRVRECYRLHARRDELSGCDLIFLSTPATHDASCAQINDALDDVLRRMKRKLGEANGSDREGAGLTHSSNQCADETTRLEEGGSPAPIEPATTESSQAQPIHVKTSLFAAIALSVIRFYQRFISPGLPPSCRFYPSCSRYTYGAIERFGLARGLWLGGYRVCRCHPWNAGGVDEVPAQFPALQSVKARSVEKAKAFFARRRFDSPRN